MATGYAAARRCPPALPARQVFVRHHIIRHSTRSIAGDQIGGESTTTFSAACQTEMTGTFRGNAACRPTRRACGSTVLAAITAGGCHLPASIPAICRSSTDMTYRENGPR